MTSGSIPLTDAPAVPRVSRKLVASLGLGNIGTFMTWGAVPSVLLALQMNDLDAGSKEANLALASVLGAIISTASQPVWGLLSDRARTRWGRRAPFILTLAIGGAISMFAISQASTLWMIVAGWCLIHVLVTGMQGALEAVLPDRVPEALRGIGAAALGLGAMFGVLIGQLTAAMLVKKGYLIAYGFVALVLVLVAVLFVVLNPDVDNRDRPREKLDWRSLPAKLWVNPRKHPDFAWTFWGRLLMLLGFNMVQNFQLYIVMDYIGVGKDAALGLTPVLAVCSLGASLISIPLSGWLSDRTGRRKPWVIASALLIGVALLLPFFSATVPTMIATASIGGFGFGMYRAVDLSLISLVLPNADDNGKDLGIAGIASNIGDIVAPAASGFVILTLGGYRPLFLVAFALCVIGAVCVMFVRSVR
ncbi:MAG: MFS transporter [Actinobacteria bacterium]|nr:MFS transporter [Actinomycetota bacterium]